jgi:hypothetical protein
MELVISSYPRSGSTYFAHEICSHIDGKNIKKTHKINLDLEKTVNVYLLRNPIDSISSAISMLKYFKKDADLEYEIKSYNESINYHIDNINNFIPFKYSQIFLDVNACSEYVLSIGYGINPYKKTNNLKVKDDGSQNFLRTSKSYSKYDHEWINVFKNKDIDDSVLLYEKMIECIDKRQKELNIKID